MLAACSGARNLALPPQVDPLSLDATGTGTERFALSVPAGSTSSLSARISLLALNGAPPPAKLALTTISLAPKSGACRAISGGRICTASAGFPAGAAIFDVQLFAGPKGTGTKYSDSAVFGSIVAGTTREARAVVAGTPASLAFSANILSAPADGGVHTFTAYVAAIAKSGATIVGPALLPKPITLTVGNDPNGALSIGSTSVTTPDLKQTAIALTYDSSKTLTDGTLSASLGGAHDATLHVDPLIVSSLQAPGLIAGAAANTALGAYDFTISQFGARQFSVRAQSASVNVNCDPRGCTAAAPGDQVAVRLRGVSPGNGSVQIGNARGAALSLPYSVASLARFAPAIAGGFAPAYGLTGPDGNLWFFSNASGSAAFVQLSPRGALLHRYAAPASTLPIPAAAQAAGGGIWFIAGSSKIGRIGTAGTALGNVSTFTIPAFNGEPKAASAIARGPDGAMWFTQTTGSIGRITEHGVVTQTAFSLSPQLTAIAAGADGAMWFASAAPGYLGRISMQGLVSDWSIALPNGDAAHVSSNLVDGPGKNLWAILTDDGSTQTGARSLCAFTLAGKIARCYPQPELEVNAIVNLAYGADRALWIAMQSAATPGGNLVLRVDAAGTRTSFVFTGSAYAPQAIAPGPGLALWACDPAHGAVIRLLP